MVKLDLAGVFKFIVTRLTLVAIVALALLCCYFSYKFNHARAQIDQLTGQVIELKKGEKQKVVVYRDRVQVVTRLLNGTTVYVDHYLPPEGSIVVVTPDKPKPDSPTTIVVKDKGFTSRFGMGVVFSPTANTTSVTQSPTKKSFVLPMIDWKFAYYTRYSALLQFNSAYFGPAITRHVDDILPESLHAGNIEIGLNAGWEYANFKPFPSRVGIEARSNF